MSCACHTVLRQVERPATMTARAQSPVTEASLHACPEHAAEYGTKRPWDHYWGPMDVVACDCTAEQLAKRAEATRV
jgi:hypothetical protein